MKKVPSVRMPDPKAGVIRSEHPRDVGVMGLVESHNWILRDGHVKLRDGIVPVAVPAMTLITPGASWSDEGGNVWSASLSTEPQSVWMDGVKGTNDLTPDAEYDWYFLSSTLYIYSTTDPDTTYTDPGVSGRAALAAAR